eukprot:gnl/MRDRNA2_/MRDRNA2_153848_c0_seq1.p1 gnl/MRDRNA2_/MRDRNA2_153848_c0~~gnl/MRDRNA2_/MRDRNA2_153848_c0_seq1.p1  ORF type:complete len:186 (+),score=36.46 gnl/MRDRNA2_/MRDRNA2_153848_c0_seq1:29-559(+)
MPARAKLVGMLVAFKDLQRTQQRVGSAGGFDLSAYDAASRPNSGKPSPYALWEYEHVAVSQRHVLLELDLKSEPHDVALTVELHMLSSKDSLNGNSGAVPNALVCWLDYELDSDGLVVVRGVPEDTTEPSHHRVAVQFIDEDRVAAGFETTKSMKVRTVFDAANRDVILDIAKSDS